MNKKIKVIIKVPGAKPYVTYISPTEEAIRKKLGGQYRRLRYAPDCCVICRKDTAGLDYNCEFLGRDFWGPVIWVGYAETAFLPFPEEFKIFRTIYYSLFSDFERGDKQRRGDISKLIGTVFLIGIWGYIGYEFVRQVIELL